MSAPAETIIARSPAADALLRMLLLERGYASADEFATAQAAAGPHGDMLAVLQAQQVLTAKQAWAIARLYATETGRPLPATVAVAAAVAAPLICPYCRTACRVGDRYCFECGRDVQAAPTAAFAPAPAPTPAMEPLSVAEPGPAAMAGWQHPYPPYGPHGPAAPYGPYPPYPSYPPYPARWPRESPTVAVRRGHLTHARLALGMAAVLSFLGGVVIFYEVAQQAPSAALVLLGVNWLLGAAHGGLLWWSWSAPLPAFMVAIAMYSVVQAMNIMLDPEMALNFVALVIAGWIITALVLGIRAAIEVREQEYRLEE